MGQGKIKVGITHGDVNGISYEIMLNGLSDNRMLELCTPIIYGSSKVAAYYRKTLEINQLSIYQIFSAREARNEQINILNCVGENVVVEMGTVSASAGEAAYLALERAIEDLRNGQIDVLVTAPINKHAIQSEKFRFAGHTEYLENRAGEKTKSLMILLKDNLRVALVTGHMPLAKVPNGITVESVGEKLCIFDHSLKQDFGIVRPRIAVLSLNPHAGEQGLLGNEEQTIIIPAIKQAETNGILAFGPYPSDGFFGSGNYASFDGVLAMYHDQGLIPFKTISMEEGVNFTAGLPFVRTAPAHGSAYDIVGQGKASAASFRKAIYTAIDVYRNRNRHKEATAHPLKKQFYDRGNDNDKLDLTKDEE